MLAAGFPFLLSLELLAEYRSVLLREPIQRRHRLSEHEVDLILTEIAANGIVREPADAEPGGLQADPGDRHLIRLLAAHPASVLVTGDRDLRRAVRSFRSELSPADFVRLLEDPKAR